MIKTLFLIIVIILQTSCSSSTFNNRLTWKNKDNLTERQHSGSKSNQSINFNAYSNILFLSETPDSFCHIHIDEDIKKDFIKELGFNGNLDEYMFNIIRSGIKSSPIEIYKIPPENIFGDGNPLMSFIKHSAGEFELSRRFQVKPQYLPVIQKVARETKSRIFLLNINNRKTHGKSYLTACLGIRFVTKNFPELKATYIHTPSFGIYSVQTGKRIGLINPIRERYENIIMYPKDINNLSLKFKKKVLSLAAKTLKQEIINKIVKGNMSDMKER